MQNRENVKYTLLIFFIHGEAAAPHLCDLADDEEAVRVDGVDQLFQAGKLPAGDDAQQHGTGVMGVAARTIQDGDTAVQLVQDGAQSSSALVLISLTSVRLSPQSRTLSRTMT